MWNKLHHIEQILGILQGHEWLTEFLEAVTEYLTANCSVKFSKALNDAIYHLFWDLKVCTFVICSDFVNCTST